MFGMQVTGLSANRCAGAIAILGNLTGGSSPMWNRGIVLSNSSVRLASFQDFTSATTSLDLWGSHTYGLDSANSNITGAAIRLGLGQNIASRNDGNTADLKLLSMGAGNILRLGDFNTPQPQIVMQTTGSMAPGTDNGPTSGISGARWSSVWAVNGTIQTSDPALKTDIAPLPSVLPLVLAVDPITFRWKSGGKVPVEVEREVEVHATETYESEEGSVELVDGVATWVSRTVSRETPDYDDVPVFNPDGTPAMTTIPATGFGPAHEVQRTHRQPRMTMEKRTVIEMQDKPGARTHWGFDATEVKAAFDRIGMDFGGYVLAEDGTHHLRPDQLIPVLWRALQELQEQVEELRDAR